MCVKRLYMIECRLCCPPNNIMHLLNDLYVCDGGDWIREMYVDFVHLWWSYLANSSFSSCSDTNWPRLATNSVEHGAFAARGGFGGCEPPVDPPGLAKAGLGKK